MAQKIKAFLTISILKSLKKNKWMQKTTN